jgi:ribonuclease-3
MAMATEEEINVLKSVYNKNNKLITKEAIKYFLKQGGIEKEPKNLDLWQRVFIHKSYCKNQKKNFMFDKLLKQVQEDEKEKDASSDEEYLDFNIDEVIPLYDDSNEKLEWLGDGILQSVITRYLWMRYGEQTDEGFLTKTRSKLVKTEPLSKLAKKLGLDEYVIISRGVEKHFNGRDNAKILEDCLEAFLGVLSLDFGAEGPQLCEKFFLTLLEEHIDMSEVISKNTNYKDCLMRYYQKEFNGKYPIYNIESEDGAINNKTYKMYVTNTSGKKVGQGVGKSKKEAEQNAAKSALEYFGIMTD